MQVKIVDKYKEGEHGPWLPLKDVPQKVLLEMDDDNGNPSGKPAIKIDNLVFHFGKTHTDKTKFRVLALGSMVVCIQD